MMGNSLISIAVPALADGTLEWTGQTAYKRHENGKHDFLMGKPQHYSPNHIAIGTADQYSDGLEEH